MTASINLPITLSPFDATTTYTLTYRATPDSVGTWVGPVGSTTSTSGGSDELTFTALGQDVSTVTQLVNYRVENDTFDAVEIELEVSDSIKTHTIGPWPINGIENAPTFYTPGGSLSLTINVPNEGYAIYPIPAANIPDIYGTGSPAGTGEFSDIEVEWYWPSGKPDHIHPYIPNIQPGCTHTPTANGSILNCINNINNTLGNNLRFQNSMTGLGFIAYHDAGSDAVGTQYVDVYVRDTVHTSNILRLTWALTITTDDPEATNLNSTHNYDEDITYSFGTVPQITDTLTGSAPDNYVVTLTLGDALAGSLDTTVTNSATKTWSSPTLTIVGTKADVNSQLSGLEFYPAADYNSSFNITYVQTNPTDPADWDSGTLTTGTLSMIGTDSTDFTAPSILSYTEDTPLTITGLQITDVRNASSYESIVTLSSPTNGQLSTSGSGGTATYTSGTGVLTITGTKAEVNSHLTSLVFTPNADFNSNVTLDYEQNNITDSVAQGTATITLQGTGSDEVVNVPATHGYREDTTLTVSNPPEITDVASGKHYTVYLTPSNAAFGRAETTGGTWDSGNSRWVITGSKTQVNNDLQTLVYVPSLDVTATNTITYEQIQTTDGITQVNNTLTFNCTDPDDDLNGSTVARQYFTNTATYIFDGIDTTALAIGDYATGYSYSLDIVVGGSSLGDLYHPSVNVPGSGITWDAPTQTMNLSGTKADINSWLYDVQFRPSTANTQPTTTLTYTLERTTDSVVQVNGQVVSLQGVTRTALYNGNASHSYTEDTVYELSPRVSSHFYYTISDVVVTLQMQDQFGVALGVTSGANSIGVLDVANPVGHISSAIRTAQTSWNGNTLTIGATNPGNTADVVSAIMRSGITFTPHVDVYDSFQVAITATDNVNSITHTGTLSFTGTNTADYVITTPLVMTEDATYSFGINAPQILDAVSSDTYTVQMDIVNPVTPAVDVDESVGRLQSTYGGINISSLGIWTASGNKSAVNNILSSLVFIPTANWDQNFSIRYTQQRTHATGTSLQANAVPINVTVQNIDEDPIWNTAAGTLGYWVSGGPVNYQLDAFDPDTGDTITFGIYSGALPTGVTLSSSGLLSGTMPTVSNLTVWNFEVIITDSTGRTAVRAFQMYGELDSPISLEATTGSNLYTNYTRGRWYKIGNNNLPVSANIQRGETITYNITGLPTGTTTSPTVPFTSSHYDNNVSAVFESTANVPASTTGTYNVTYSVQDALGTSSQIQTWETFGVTPLASIGSGLPSPHTYTRYMSASMPRAYAYYPSLQQYYKIDVVNHSYTYGTPIVNTYRTTPAVAVIPIPGDLLIFGNISSGSTTTEEMHTISENVTIYDVSNSNVPGGGMPYRTSSSADSVVAKSSAFMTFYATDSTGGGNYRVAAIGHPHIQSAPYLVDPYNINFETLLEPGSPNSLNTFLNDVQTWGVADREGTSSSGYGNGYFFQTRFFYVQNNRVYYRQFADGGSSVGYKMYTQTPYEKVDITNDLFGTNQLSAASMEILHSSWDEFCLDVDGTKYECVNTNTNPNGAPTWTAYTAPVSKYSSYATNPHAPLAQAQTPHNFRVCKVSGTPNEYHFWQKGHRPLNAADEWELVATVSDADVATNYEIVEPSNIFMSCQSGAIQNTSYAWQWTYPCFVADKKYGLGSGIRFYTV